jgi:type IV pilus assembly protein PilM
MEFLPRSLGTRPRLACEVRADGVVAARAEDATAVLQAVARVSLTEGIVLPQFHPDPAAAENGTEPGSVAGGVRETAGREALVGALRTALEQVGQRGRDVTLVVPDAAVRVLLLDFDALTAKAAEALPVVRFRLKKLLPFDADGAAVSYQVMATTRAGLQVLAVAMPREVQAEYERLVREAGFEPGAVLPSTLAALAGLAEGETPMLVVNAGLEGVTTAIVKSGVLLLHRTVDLGGEAGAGAVRVEVAAAAAAQEPADISIAAIAARLKALDARAAMQPAAAAERGADAGWNEVGQAVSVATAYFEDTLETAPTVVLSAGPLGAEALTAVLGELSAGMGVEAVAVQEIVSRQMLGEGAASAGLYGGIPLGWLAGVRGALAN